MCVSATFRKDFAAIEIWGHNAIPNVGNVVYAVIPTCPYYMLDPNHAGPTGSFQLDRMTVATTHEVMEAVTDPFATHKKPAYNGVSDGFLEWEIPAGGEVADMCVRLTGSLDAWTLRPAGLPYLLQRTWSNAAAGSGHDPCVPAPPGPYFVSAPLLPDSTAVPYPDALGDITMAHAHTITVPVGGSMPVTLDLYSDGTTSGPWTVQGVDLSGVLGLTGSGPDGGAPQKLTFDFDKNEGVAGDHLTMTIANHVASPAATPFGFFQVVSTLGDRSTLWTGAVVDSAM